MFQSYIKKVLKYLTVYWSIENQREVDWDWEKKCLNEKKYWIILNVNLDSPNPYFAVEWTII